ncbi:terpenoid synthase [Viridothelium virens]|uniref:Terpenoid synthase n=1 Tax=Viridothelium virens TaxID=1048519 RepID=A0A6A6GS92_VIRVR|nr:terpenoid synthase [Viridothelium virens]
MDFRYSELVNPNTYETDGLCDGIVLRINKDLKGEIRGAIRCQKDWSMLIEPLHNYKGTLGSPFSFVRVTVPETIDGRLEIISYANEFAFLYDDTIIEDLDEKLESESRRQLVDDFGTEITSREDMKRLSESMTPKGKGIKQIQSQILNEMMAIDRERGLTTMNSWQKFWFGLVTFGMGLTIPDEELDLCKRLGRPSWAALALTNDLYSWEKERDDAARNGSPHVMNAVYVLMGEHSVAEARAKDMCRKTIKDCVAEAVHIVNKIKHDSSISRDLQIYLEAILYSVSGNLVWSKYCPRYNPKETYDNHILSMMAENVKAEYKSHT